MAKRPAKQTRRTRAQYAEEGPTPVVTRSYAARVKREAIAPKTEIQAIYMNAIRTADIVFGTGPAGTGKTFLPTAMAADALAAQLTEKIILTRPAVQAGEEFGFLPGEIEEKYEPYLQPFREVLAQRMGKGAVDCAVKNGKIEPVPLAFMRGRTFDNCWVIVDEAQNVTPAQMKMLLTRIGENCKVIICGDTDQVDIDGPSGLTDAVRRCEWMDNVSVVEFEPEDCIRSKTCMDVLKSYASN